MQPVNMVDAIATVVPRVARSRSAIMRQGTVTGAPVNNVVEVTLGDTTVPNPGKVKAGFPATYWPMAGERVFLVNDRDGWYILSRAATNGGVPSTYDPVGGVRFSPMQPNISFTGTGAWTTATGYALPVTANAIYELELVAWFLGNTGVGAQVGWSFPTGTNVSLNGCIQGLLGTATAETGPGYFVFRNVTTSPGGNWGCGTITGTYIPLRSVGSYGVGTVGGTLQLLVAQLGAGAACWLGSGSYIKLTRMS